MTFEQLQQAVGQLSQEERAGLWRSCPTVHPPENLVVLETSFTTGVLRYCPRCFVAFTDDGRALNAPGRREER